MTGAERSHAYGMAVTWVASIASIAISLAVSFTVSDRSAKSEQASREATRLATCIVVNAQVSVYNEQPPSTPTGVKAQQAWRDLRVRLRCEST